MKSDNFITTKKHKYELFNDCKSKGFVYNEIMVKCLGRREGTVYLSKLFTSFEVVFIVFCQVNRTFGETINPEPHEFDQNVGSVLFDQSDVQRKCWSDEQIALLISRSIFQDILPKVELINSEDDKFVEILMNYTDICLEVVKKLTTGKTNRLLLRALADTLGGYLRVYILPLTKKSFYAGKINYQSAKKLYNLYEELKLFLHSNGIGWLRPKNPHENFDVNPIIIPPEGNNNVEACKNLILYSDENDGGVPTVPIPFLDDDNNPGSIAVPFQDESLFSLFNENSSFILVKYYSAGVNCTSSTQGKHQVNKFQEKMNNWLSHSVNRHLNDEKWYPAFGGIFSILLSLKNEGFTIEEYQRDEDLVMDLIVGSQLETTTCAPANDEILWDLKTVLLFILIVIPIWLLIGCIITYCQFKEKRRSKVYLEECYRSEAGILENCECTSEEEKSDSSEIYRKLKGFDE